jgi:hypothetical protein
MPVLPIALVAIVAGLITYDIANKDEPLPPAPIMSSTSTEAPAPVAVVDQPVTTAPVPTPPEPPRKERKKAEKKPQACK